MNKENDNRFDARKQSGQSESRPAAPTSSTANNPSVYQQPAIEQATKDGKVDKLDENSNEDRKHTP